MISDTPIMGAAKPPLNNILAAASKPHLRPLSTVPVAFEPRRSSLVFWSVRVAQVADRIVARAFPTAETARPHTDGLVEKTLNGLDRCFRLIPTHQGVVAAERARLQIQEVLEVRRDRNQLFQRLRRAMRDGVETTSRSSLCIHMNPVCRWIRMADEPAQERSPKSSGSVLFFLVDNELRGLRMDLEGQVLINELVDYQPCTIPQWARLSTLADAQQLDALVGHFADIGLVALCTE